LSDSASKARKRKGTEKKRTKREGGEVPFWERGSMIGASHFFSLFSLRVLISLPPLLDHFCEVTDVLW